MSSRAYRPGEEATLNVLVTMNGQPVENARLTARFNYPGHVLTCSAVTDSTGAASCGFPAPDVPDGTLIFVELQVLSPAGQSVVSSTSFVVQNPGR
jgi:hypothetical protein